MTQQEATKLIKSTIRARGYMVLRWSPGPLDPPEVGKVIDYAISATPSTLENLRQKFFCESTTTAADWKEQQVLAGFTGAALRTRGCKFFRIILVKKRRNQ